MTASGSGVPGRGTTMDDTPRRGIGREIAAILVIGLVARLILAYLLPGSGFANDLASFQGWAHDLYANGLPGFYDRPGFHDYTPGYLYALWLVGAIGSFLGGIGDLIKIPAILADLAIGWLVYDMAQELGVSRRSALIAAAVAVFNPVSWFDSVVWGQVDSFGVVFLLLSIRELWRGRTERSAVLAVVAALIKPQLGILAFIVAAVTIRRALWPAGSWGDEPEPAPSGIGPERSVTGPIRIITTALAGFLTAIALSAPFGLSLTGLIGQLFKTAAGYPYLTLNAYNLWALVGAGGGSMADNGGWTRDAPPIAPATDPYSAFFGVPAVVIGAVLLAAVIIGVSLLVARRPDRRTILVGVAVLALAFFAVPTRVHERYLYPLFALAGILLAFSWRWRLAYTLASIAVFLNMYVVLTTIYSNNPSISDWLGIGPAIHSAAGITLVALTITGVFLWSLLQLRDRAAQKLQAELEDEAAAAAWAEQEAAGFGTPIGLAGPADEADWATPPTVRPGGLVPAWFDRPSLAVMTPLRWLRARVAETPIRPDRSATLKNEKGGRLDRLDLWMVIVLVLAAMCLRTFRLAEPAQMHFDEVYHARTATEFLQDWRYGISHNIYEWTHPHLAKYVIAGGITVFAGHDVAASSDLGVSVKDAVIEPRYEDATSADARDGDRVWAVTGTQLIAYDLLTRKVEATWDIPGASVLAYDATNHVVTVGTDKGALETVDATSLDQVRAGVKGAAPSVVTPLGTLAAAPLQLIAWDTGARLAARFADGTVAVVDAASGAVTGTAKLNGTTDLADMGSGDALVATLASVKDAAATAKALAGAIGGDAAGYQKALQTTGATTVVLHVTLDSDTRTKLKAAIDAKQLTGIAIGQVPLLAVTDASGVEMLADNAAIADRVQMAGPAFGVASVTHLSTGNQLYVSTQSKDGETPEIAWILTSGKDVVDGPVFSQNDDTMAMPGPVTKVLYDESALMVEVLGKVPGTGESTVYVIEPHGNAVFADHKLGFAPTAVLMDHNPDYPSTSPGQILAFSPAGQVAALDIGHYDFSWRMPGVIFGALSVGLIYLLTRILFKRRLVAGLAGLFVLLDGMMFVQSRIAMNDVYVGFFLLAAYALFAWLWVEPRPRKWFWALMPVIGVLLGLGLGSKWVAAYAIGALGILVLARSALGRLVLILGMAGMTAVLGWMALVVPTGNGSVGNVIFPLIMIVLTLATIAITVYRPVAWSDDEIRFAVGAPAAAGTLLALAAIALNKVDTSIALGPLKLTPLPVAFLLIVLAGLVYVGFNVAGRMGFGPMALADPDRPRRAGSPAPEGWLRLGDGLGLSTLWWAACLVVVPLVVYILLYIPWANVENHQIVTAGFPGFPQGWPPGHTGQTLQDLTGEMYRYHNDLASPHPASSPWWAWPLNLKPVWFYQGSFANDTGGAIYDAGTIAIWWMSIPAMAFVAFQAFKRRSLPLALLLVGFLAQWISWARIDRAAFEYHYYTSLPFLIIALAYFVAEIWHGASRRTWLLARAAAAVGVMGPALMWLFRLPLCAIADVNAMQKDSQACNGNPGNLVITPSVGALVVILLVGGGLLVWQLVNLSRPRADGRALVARDAQGVLATGIVVVALALLTRLLPASDPLFSINGLSPEPIAILGLALCGLIASQIVTARDARRFVGGLVAAIAINFALLYPDISGLPLPSSLLPWYQGVLPTYLYPFQFWSNQANRNVSTSFSDPRFFVLVAFLVLASAAVAYSAWTWRQALADSMVEAGEAEP
ncbi:MAG TPA: phospholipid carrier-dependent glycosyltransferase, partial [Candidatus Limnocylindrales bacterium]